MINKRNFFKTLSSAALGALMVGNFSNVRMMEPNSKKMELTYKQYMEIMRKEHDDERLVILQKKLRKY